MAVPQKQLPPTIAANIDRFTGRAWLLPPLLDWLEHGSQRIFLLTGGPGTGKSMIMAWLAGHGPAPTDPAAAEQLSRLRGQVKAVHYCVAAGGSTDPKDLARQIAEQLTRSVPGFGTALAATLGDQVKIVSHQQIGRVEAGGSVTGVYIANLNLGGLSEELSFNRILRDPLKRLYADGYNEPLVLLVDALDEAMTYTGGTNIIQLLAKLTDLPSEVRILATTRDDPRVTKFFRGSHTSDLITDAPAGTDDVRLYVTERLAAFSAELDPVSCDQLVTRIAAAAKGIFLYASLTLDELLPHLPEVADLEHYPLPTGLSGLYHDFLNRELGRDEGRWYENLQPVLGLIAVAQGDGLTRTQLAAISGKEVEQPLRICKQYLAGELPEGPFRVFHQSFRDFLLEDESNIDFHFDARTWHNRIAEYFLGRYDHNWTACQDPYCLAYLAQHLHQAGRPEALQDLIDDSGWFIARITSDPSKRGFVADLDLAHNASVQQGQAAWPALLANSLIRASLSAVASYLPPEAYEALARIGRWEEAIDRALLITDVQRREQIVGRLQRTAIELNNPDFSHRVRSVMAVTPPCDDERATPAEPWLLDSINRWGAERTLRQQLQHETGIDPDGTWALERHLEVAAAATQADRPSEARAILGKALGFVSATWPHQRRDPLLQIARLLMKIGFEEDVSAIVETAEQLELEDDRVWALSELALICADATREDLRQRSLDSAVRQLEQAKRRSTLQFELGKVALAMCKLHDDRAERFLDQALQLGQRAIQPAWRWEEQRAWASLVCALARCGFCDQALVVAGRLPPLEVNLAKLVVELAVRDRWDDAWSIAQQLHPISRVQGLLEAGFSLARAKKLLPDQCRAIIDHITDDLEQNKLILDRLDKLGQLINLALTAGDVDAASRLFSQVMAMVEKADPNQLAELLKIASRLAVPKSDRAALTQLQSRLQEVPTGEGRQGAEAATAQVALAFAALGEMEHARVLAEKVSDQMLRLDVSVRIARLAHQLGMESEKYFVQALALARTVQNSGWTPARWAYLARLAHDLSKTDVLNECLTSAIRGAATVADGYYRGLNVHNCTEVARVLHEQGFADEAVGLLKIGLSHASTSHLGRDALLSLSSIAAQLRASVLWDDLLTTAIAMERTDDRDEVLLGILAGIAETGEYDRARETLATVIGIILEGDPNWLTISHLGKVLAERLSLTSEELHAVIASALTRARTRDRPTVLTWVAALLPAITRLDTNLAAAAWPRLERADAMLRG